MDIGWALATAEDVKPLAKSALWWMKAYPHPSKKLGILFECSALTTVDVVELLLKS